MNSRSGLSFADVLIILAIGLLLAALAVPKFIKAPDFGTEEDDLLTNNTNDTSDVDMTNRIDQAASRREARATLAPVAP